MSTINGTINGTFNGTINGTVMRAINESIISEMTSSSPEETTNTVLSTTSQNLGEIFCNIIIFHQTNTFPSTPHKNLGEIHSHPYHWFVTSPSFTQFCNLWLKLKLNNLGRGFKSIVFPYIHLLNAFLNMSSALLLPFII